MKNAKLLLLALTVTTLSACGGGATSGQPAPTPPSTGQPAPIPPSPQLPVPGTLTPYVMTGTVRAEAGEPLADVEVFADHTAYYNMNALGKTDAQGRYRIALAHQPGTWAAGAYLRLSFGGQMYEVRLSPDTDMPFDGAQGAVRDFTLGADDLPSGKVNTSVAHSAVELDYDTLDFTFTPDGPNMLGSTTPFTRPFTDGSGVLGVPIGRYFVSATHVLNGIKEQLLLSSADQKTFAPRVLALFHDEGDRYGNTMELYLKNP
ncbi:carboxypeptidase regulatory-like domain-containing protein [Deinococcus sp. Arct2-2]|uniref:carboxypeptidase regulatory-like domain-containing protein n=1 Tax=Deinococcus sp. Arct2-2 TaxID=2568653 RepID=UPI0010A37866|nr:carboxypeptidase regulatory-like domain-containing protein [Deinococcus sp. Arct2-2]THF70909.1 carboxypeptidase regulatory-like domain-containing protein [Deinococcus sp. Arct2-2]